MELTRLNQIRYTWLQMQKLAAQGDAPEVSKRLEDVGQKLISQTQGLTAEDKQELQKVLFKDRFDSAAAPHAETLANFLNKAQLEVPAGWLEAGSVTDIQSEQIKRKNLPPLDEEVRAACEKALETVNKLAKEHGIDLPGDISADMLMHDAIDQLGSLSPKDRERLSQDPSFRAQVTDMIGKTFLMHLVNQPANAATGANVPGAVMGAGATTSASSPATNERRGLSEVRAQQLQNLINDPSIPIEELVMRALLLFAQDSDERLRDKFKEFSSYESKTDRCDKAIKAREAELKSRTPPATEEQVRQEMAPLYAEREQLAKSSGDDERNNRMNLNAQIQVLMQDRTEMYNLLTNVIKQFHEMSMTSIRNIRG